MNNQSITLQQHQSAIILGAGEDGEISVEVASADHQGLSGALCQAIVHKLMHDEQFQEELMGMLDFEDE